MHNIQTCLKNISFINNLFIAQKPVLPVLAQISVEGQLAQSVWDLPTSKDNPPIII